MPLIAIGRTYLGATFLLTLLASSIQLRANTWLSVLDSNSAVAETEISRLTLLSEGCSGVEIFSLEEVIVDDEPCGSSTLVCISDTGSEDITFKLNGVPYPGVQTCSRREVTQYNLAGLLEDGDTAHEVSWKVGAGVYRTRIGTAQELVAFVKASTPEVSWTLEENGQFLEAAYHDRFGELSAVSAITGESNTVPPTLALQDFGTAIELDAGLHTVTAKTSSGCLDTILVEVTCVSTRQYQVNAVVGVRGSYCQAVAGNADEYSFTVIDRELNGVIDAGEFDDDCISFEATAAGTANILVEYCHNATGTCERAQLNFKAFPRDAVKPPHAVADLYALALNGQRMMDVAANDEVIGGATELYFDPLVTLGEVRVDGRQRLHYTAPKNYCGTDRIAYEICNAGGCDTASVKIQITCDELLVFNGFSPNGDGVNDSFTVLGLENFPSNELVVFNAHGHEVFSERGYKNDWDGTYRGSPLLDGTYFYVLNIEGQSPSSGYVQIRR